MYSLKVGMDYGYKKELFLAYIKDGHEHIVNKYPYFAYQLDGKGLTDEDYIRLILTCCILRPQFLKPSILGDLYKKYSHEKSKVIVMTDKIEDAFYVEGKNLPKLIILGAHNYYSDIIITNKVTHYIKNIKHGLIRIAPNNEFRVKVENPDDTLLLAVYRTFFNKILERGKQRDFIEKVMRV